MMESEPQIKAPSAGGLRSESRDRGHSAELSWDFRKEALKKAFQILETTEENLAQTKADDGYQQYLANLRGTLKSWDSVPVRYRTYLNHLIRYIAIENPPYDSWIRAWVEDRAESLDVEMLNNLSWNPWWDFGKFSTEPGVQDKVGPGQREDDFFSFGKRASVMEFTFEGATETSPMRIQFPRHTRPTVTQVTRDPAFIKPSSGIRWIHLPANNMFWVEVRYLALYISLFLSRTGITNQQTLVKAIYENDPNIPEHERYDPTILTHKFWRGRQDASAVETRFGHRHYARFMRPTCLKTRTGKFPTRC
jgi:hypothetical protein